MIEGGRVFVFVVAVVVVVVVVVWWWWGMSNHQKECGFEGLCGLMVGSGVVCGCVVGLFGRGGLSCLSEGNQTGSIFFAQSTLCPRLGSCCWLLGLLCVGGVTKGGY